MKSRAENKQKILKEKLSERADKKQRELATWMQAQSTRLSAPVQKKLFILFTVVASAFFILIIVGSLKPKEFGTVENITVPGTENGMMPDSNRSTGAQGH